MDPCSQWLSFFRKRRISIKASAVVTEITLPNSTCKIIMVSTFGSSDSSATDPARDAKLTPLLSLLA